MTAISHKLLFNVIQIMQQNGQLRLAYQAYQDKMFRNNTKLSPKVDKTMRKSPFMLRIKSLRQKSSLSILFVSITGKCHLPLSDLQLF